MPSIEHDTCTHRCHVPDGDTSTSNMASGPRMCGGSEKSIHVSRRKPLRSKQNAMPRVRSSTSTWPVGSTRPLFTSKRSAKSASKASSSWNDAGSAP